MRKKLIAVCLSIFLILLVLTPPPPSYAWNSIPITAPTAILMDPQTHHVVYAKTPYVKRPPASTVKLLTAMVALDMLPIDSWVTIPEFAEKVQPSKAHLRHGERYRAWDLVRAILISSANDAAEVLAVAAAGSKVAFARRMNQKAYAIGCRSSHFVNPSGLPAGGQYSTVSDMALIMEAAGRYPFIVSALKTRSQVIYSSAGRRIYLKSHNKMLLRGYRGVVGKTGWTRKAGYCFVGFLTAFEKTVLVAMLGSRKLWQDVKILLNFHSGKALAKIRENRKIWARHDVEKIQTALKRAGCNPGPIDGFFGSRTASAVEQFQKTHGLEVDGIVGPNTWRKLKSYL
ncbi:MAG: peptidoglycan-binding protein [Candidatus Omnitrophica bacterium]|nr:peptidoglycan-binding protein [Candidatus Omnitrophota bacterium]